MATSTAPRIEAKEPKKDEKEPLSRHADRPVDEIEDARRVYEERVQGKAPEFVPTEKKSDD